MVDDGFLIKAKHVAIYIKQTYNPVVIDCFCLSIVRNTNYYVLRLTLTTQLEKICKNAQQ
jgi:hypothetical protein